jgi:hypothetical protein
MKKENDNLDLLLKQKLAENAIPFKESYWESARGLVNAERTKSKRIYWLFLPAFCLLAGLFIYADNSFVSNYNSLPIDKNLMTSKSTIIENQCKDNRLAKIQENFINLKENNKLEIKEDLTTEKNNSTQQNNITSADIIKISNIEKPNKASKENLIEEEMALSEKENMFNLNQDDLKVIKTENEKSEITIPKIIQPYLFKGFNITKRDLEKTGKLALINPSKKRKLLNTFTSINLGIQSNANFIPSYQMSMFWHVLANHQLSFYSGLGIFQSAPELGKRSYQENTYSFGETNKSISIDTRKLYYLNVPLGIELKVKGRHEINLACNFMYLLSSEDRFYYYNNGILVDKKTKDSHISLFEQSDVLLESNYGYWLNTKSKISLGYFYGMKNITDAMVFENPDKNRNKGIKFGIQYNLN